MKKNEKGFTLVELLAVIVVLGIIMTIAGTAVLRQKKTANEKEVESIYNSIKELGADVYIQEKKLNKEIFKNNDKLYFDTAYLMNNGYLKTVVKNPSNSSDTCEAYLLIDKDSDDMFDAYVKCDGIDPQGGTDPTADSSDYTLFRE